MGRAPGPRGARHTGTFDHDVRELGVRAPAGCFPTIDFAYADLDNRT
ncbi:hypothetical protein [Streptomyces scabiei]|nr:hypothetical protein [Streptomyces scabiei]